MLPMSLAICRGLIDPGPVDGVNMGNCLLALRRGTVGEGVNPDPLGAWCDDGLQKRRNHKDTAVMHDTHLHSLLHMG